TAQRLAQPIEHGGREVECVERLRGAPLAHEGFVHRERQRARATSGIENAKAGTDERRAKKERAQSLRIAHRTDEARVRRMSVRKESPCVWRCVQRDTSCGCV